MSDVTVYTAKLEELIYFSLHPFYLGRKEQHEFENMEQHRVVFTFRYLGRNYYPSAICDDWDCNTEFKNLTEALVWLLEGE